MSDALLVHVTQSIEVGSKSFAAASRLFEPATRRSALMLYAWCRHCDDVIDGQTSGWTDAVPPSPQEAQKRLTALMRATQQAYAGAAMGEPAFAAFQEVALKHKIPPAFAFEHLAGFEMDVNQRHYESIDETLEYCYRVAGVVGLMMAKVMGVEDEETLDRACDLGIAFQLTNIARDIAEDAQMGRCYVPLQWLRTAGVEREHMAMPENRAALSAIATQLVTYAEPYYASAGVGIKALPLRSAWAVAAARNVYREIGVKVRARAPQEVGRRVSTSSLDKLRLITSAGGFALTSRVRGARPRPSTLWRRPAPTA